MTIISGRSAASVIAGLAFCFAGCTEPASADGVASVNGTSISAEVVDVYAAGRLRKAPEEVTDEDRAGVITEVQDIYLLADLARKKGLDKDPQVVAQLSLQQKSILAQALVGEYRDNNPPTEEELRAEYDRTASGAAGRQYKARHILVETEHEAKSVIEELNKPGADFAEMARERSTGPSGPQGGDLGWFSPESMVKPFSDAVIALADGESSSSPVQTQFGWHVILREESRANTPPPFEEVKDQISMALQQQKLQQYLEEQRSAAKLESSL